MNKSIKLGSLILAGIVLVGCGNKDTQADKDKQAAEAAALKKTPPASASTTMESVKEKATTMMSGAEQKGGDMMKGMGEKMGEMGDKMKAAAPTTQPGM